MFLLFLAMKQPLKHVWVCIHVFYKKRSANSVESVEPECTGTTVPPDLQVTCRLSQDED